MSEKPLPDARPRSRPAISASEVPIPDTRVAAEVFPAGPTPDHFYPFPTRPLVGESAEQALAAQAYFLREIDPDPGLESMLAMTLIDQTRELNQLEKSKIVVIRLALSDYLIDKLKPTITVAEHLGDPHKLSKMVNAWAFGLDGEHKELRAKLAAIGLVLENIVAQAYSIAIDDLTKLDTMIDRTERRRDRSVRTFEASRAIRSLMDLRHVQVRRANLALTADASRSEGPVAPADTDRDV